MALYNEEKHLWEIGQQQDIIHHMTTARAGKVSRLKGFITQQHGDVFDVLLYRGITSYARSVCAIIK